MTISKFKNSNKVLSVLLCLALLLSYLPLSSLTAFAADGDVASVTDKDGNAVGSYASYADAITAAQSSEGSTLKLLDAVPLTTELMISSGKFTLDLNGKTLLNESGFALWIESDADVTVQDSGEGGTVESGSATSTAILNEGTLTVESGTVTGAGGIHNRGTLTFKGGTVKGSTHDAIFNYGTAYVYGGKLFAITNNSAGTLYVYDGEISGSSYAIYNFGKAYIEGGKFTGNSYAALNLLGGTVEISGGSFTGKDNEYGYYFGTPYGEWTVYYDDSVTLTLKGGEFPNGFAVSGTNVNTILAEGYKYFDADGNKITVADDANMISGYVQVKAHFVASVTDKDGNAVGTYQTLADAVTAAEKSEDSTLTLLDDITLTDRQNIDSGKFTIDLNGKTLTFTEDALYIRSANVTVTSTVSGGSIEGKNYCLFINGNVTAKVTGVALHSSGSNSVAVRAGGTNVVLTLENVTITSGNAGVSSASRGKVEILGNSSIKGNLYDIGCDNYSTLTVGAGVTFPGGLTADKSTSYYKVLNDMLADGMAYWTGDTRMVQPDASTYEITGDVTVRAECTHSDATKFTCTADGATITATCGGCNSTAGSITLTVVSTDLTYNGTKKELTAVSTIPGVEAPEIACTSDLTSAGKHTATITLGGATATLEVSIEKATPTINELDLGIPADSSYDGNDRKVAVTVKNGIVGMGTITVNYYDANGNPVNGAPVNAGTYTVKIDIAEGDNHTAITGLKVADITIYKADPRVTAPTAIDGLEYTGAAQTLITAGSTTDGELQYSLDNATWSTELPKATSVGQHTVYYKVVGDSNHNDTAAQSITVAIAKATPSITVSAPMTSLMPGNSMELTATNSLGETLSYSIVAGKGYVVDANNSMIVYINSNAPIGTTVTVTVQSNASDNCNAATGTITLDVGMADFTGEITELEKDIEELNNLIADKADADEITQKLTEINNKIAALEQNYATKEELAAAKTELGNTISALETKLNEKVAELQGQITSNDTDIDGIKENITTINSLIDALKAADETLDGKITDAVNTAKSELATAVSTLEDKIAEEVEMLQGQINANDTDIEAINTSITTINGLIDALKAADKTLDGKITEAVNTAKSDLATAVSTLEDKIAEEVEKLQNQINANNTDIEAINTSITTINGLIDALEAADETLGGQLTDAIAKAESELKAAQDELKKLIGDVQTNLDNAKAELDKAIADLGAAMNQGDADLSTEIANLNTALTNAKAALEKADADNKAELVSKIETADAALDAAINAVRKNLDDAKAELDKAIADGDTALDGKISDLNTALESAKAALEAVDAANKTELEGKITSAQTSLQAAIGQVQTNLDSAKAELDKAIADLDAAMNQGDADLSAEIANLNTALANAKAALEKADADNKAELVSKIETADTALDAAIKAVQKNLDDAKAELDKAIADGDTALDGKISDLNTALESAKAALEAADAANKTELEGNITSAQTTLQSAIDKVAKDLADAEKELADAIAAADSALSSSISSVSASLSAAKAALEKADADNKAELIAKIEAAEATLDKAIKAVQKNLNDAKAELNKAIADGDSELDGKITALNTALAEAKAALEAADSANKSELTAKIDEADVALQAAIDALSSELNNVKQKTEALESKNEELQTLIIIACVISGAAFCGCGTLAVFYFIDKKKKI